MLQDPIQVIFLVESQAGVDMSAEPLLRHQANLTAIPPSSFFPLGFILSRNNVSHQEPVFEIQKWGCPFSSLPAGSAPSLSLSFSTLMITHHVAGTFKC